MVIVISRPARQKPSYATERGCKIHMVLMTDQNEKTVTEVNQGNKLPFLVLVTRKRKLIN